MSRGTARIRSAMKTRQLFMRPTTQISSPLERARHLAADLGHAGRRSPAGVKSTSGLAIIGRLRVGACSSARTTRRAASAASSVQLPGTHSTRLPGGQERQARPLVGGHAALHQEALQAHLAAARRGRGRRAGACAPSAARRARPPPPPAPFDAAGPASRSAASRARPRPGRSTRPGTGSVEREGRGRRAAAARCAPRRSRRRPRGRPAAAAAARTASAAVGQGAGCGPRASRPRRAGRPLRSSARPDRGAGHGPGAGGERGPVEDDGAAVVAAGAATSELALLGQDRRPRRPGRRPRGPGPARTAG